MPEMLAFPTFMVKAGVGQTNPRSLAVCLGALANQPEGTVTENLSVGAVIKALRKSRNMTQADLAAALGWERSTLSAVESGHDKPGRDLVAALASFFDTSADHILNRTGRPEPKSAQTEAEAEMLRMFREASDDGKLATLATLRALTHSGH